MISKRLFHKLLLLLLLLFMFGILLHLYKNITDCRLRIERLVSREGALSKYIVDRPIAIYVINDVNTSCRTCINLEIFNKMAHPPNVLFLLNRQFSKVDIENFRAEFKLTANQDTIRISTEWLKTVKPCLKSPYQNLLIYISPDLEITQMRRF